MHHKTQHTACSLLTFYNRRSSFTAHGVTQAALPLRKKQKRGTTAETKKCIIIIQYVCLLSQAFLPGTSLEPAVIPTAQASSFTLQYFPYYV